MRIYIKNYVAGNRVFNKISASDLTNPTALVQELTQLALLSTFCAHKPWVPDTTTTKLCVKNRRILILFPLEAADKHWTANSLVTLKFHLKTVAKELNRNSPDNIHFQKSIAPCTYYWNTLSFSSLFFFFWEKITYKFWNVLKKAELLKCEKKNQAISVAFYNISAFLYCMFKLLIYSF